MKLSNYGFDFKPELIAQYPEINRDESRLIVVHRDTGEIEHRVFKDILDYFEEKGLPFIVAVNQFDHGPQYELDQVREALALPNHVPMMRIDARDRDSAKSSLIRVTEYALERLAGIVPAT